MPDPAIEGVRYVSAPLLDEENLGVTREAKVDFTDYVGQMLFYVKTAGTDIGAYFEKTYPAIATGEGAMRQLRRFFDVLLEQEEGAVLYHCTAGKDRVGTATALLLSALGVPRELIVEDFLFTNACLREETEGMMRAASAAPKMRRRCTRLRCSTLCGRAIWRRSSPPSRRASARWRPTFRTAWA